MKFITTTSNGTKPTDTSKGGPALSWSGDGIDPIRVTVNGQTLMLDRHAAMNEAIEATPEEGIRTQSLEEFIGRIDRPDLQTALDLMLKRIARYSKKPVLIKNLRELRKAYARALRRRLPAGREDDRLAVSLARDWLLHVGTGGGRSQPGIYLDADDSAVYLNTNSVVRGRLVFHELLHLALRLERGHHPSEAEVLLEDEILARGFGLRSLNSLMPELRRRFLRNNRQVPKDYNFKIYETLGLDTFTFLDRALRMVDDALRLGNDDLALRTWPLFAQRLQNVGTKQIPSSIRLRAERMEETINRLRIRAWRERFQSTTNNFDEEVGRLTQRFGRPYSNLLHQTIIDYNGALALDEDPQDEGPSISLIDETGEEIGQSIQVPASMAHPTATGLPLPTDKAEAPAETVAKPDQAAHEWFDWIALALEGLLDGYFIQVLGFNVSFSPYVLLEKWIATHPPFPLANQLAEPLAEGILIPWFLAGALWLTYGVVKLRGGSRLWAYLGAVSLFSSVGFHWIRSWSDQWETIYTAAAGLWTFAPLPEANVVGAFIVFLAGAGIALVALAFARRSWRYRFLAGMVVVASLSILKLSTPGEVLVSNIGWHRLDSTARQNRLLEELAHLSESDFQQVIHGFLFVEDREAESFLYLTNFNPGAETLLRLYDDWIPYAAHSANVFQGEASRAVLRVVTGVNAALSSDDARRVLSNELVRRLKKHVSAQPAEPMRALWFSSLQTASENDLRALLSAEALDTSRAMSRERLLLVLLLPGIERVDPEWKQLVNQELELRRRRRFGHGFRNQQLDMGPEKQNLPIVYPKRSPSPALIGAA
jgi:hypothetical protein